MKDIHFDFDATLKKMSYFLMNDDIPLWKQVGAIVVVVMMLIVLGFFLLVEKIFGKTS